LIIRRFSPRRACRAFADAAANIARCADAMRHARRCRARRHAATPLLPRCRAAAMPLPFFAMPLA